MVLLIHTLRGMKLQSDEDDQEAFTEPELLAVAEQIQRQGQREAFCNSITIPVTPSTEVSVAERIENILKEYDGTVFGTKTPGCPPVRGPFGEAEINLKPGAVPIKQRMFQIQGERRETWIKLTDTLIEQGKWEDGVSAWSSPSFPVAKKEPGNNRLVVDFRAENEATIQDAHPLPLNGDILQKQGRYTLWIVLDMKDGFHQVPLKK